GADHGADDDHGAVEEADGADESSFGAGGAGWCGGDGVSHGRWSYTAAAWLAFSSKSIYCRARFAGSAARRISPMTATESAPAASTSGAVSKVIPPMATIGFWVRRRTSRIISMPTTGSGLALEAVAKMGPMAM